MLSSYHENLFIFKPKIAISSNQLGIEDLIICIEDSIDITGFNNTDDLINEVSLAYQHFEKDLAYFRQGVQPDNAINSQPHRPFSVVLMDIEENNLLESLLICERLQAFFARPLMYTHLKMDNLIINLINQGALLGYLPKTCDIFEEMLPALFQQNKIFYTQHLRAMKLTHPPL